MTGQCKDYSRVVACYLEDLTHAEIRDADTGRLNVMIDLSGKNELRLRVRNGRLLMRAIGFSHRVLVFRKEG